MQLNLFQRRHKIRIAGLVLYFLVIPLFITIFMFVSLSGLFILKLEDGIKSGEKNPSTHDHVEFYVTKTCLVHGQSGSAAHNITCSVQPSDVLPQIIPPGMQDVVSRVLEMGKNRLLTYFLLSTMSIIASVPIIFIFKLSTIRKQCIALSVCNLITSIFLILATTSISQLPSQVLNTVAATVSSNKILVVRGIRLLFVSCLTTIVSCVILCAFVVLGWKKIWRDEDENWIWEHIHKYCCCGSRS